jgi:hypothetical protein
VPESDAIERYVNAVFLASIKLGASHIRIRPVGVGLSVELWIDGSWQPQSIGSPTLTIHMRVMRRLAVLLGQLVPPQGSVLTGGLELVVGGGTHHYFLVAIDHDLEIAAYIELVDKPTFESRKEPRPPMAHPFRSYPS